MTTTEELAVSDSKTLFALCDDLAAYHESLGMLEAEELVMICEHPQEDRGCIEVQLEEVRSKLEVLGKQLASKTDAAAAVLRRIKVEREFIADERDRLKLKEKASERAEEWLRGYILSTMERNGLQHLKTATNTFVTRGSEAVDITDVTVIPAEYFNVEVKLPLQLWRSLLDYAKTFGPSSIAEAAALNVKATPSMSTIKKAIKQGVDVPGADLKLNSNLVLR